MSRAILSNSKDDTMNTAKTCCFVLALFVGVALCAQDAHARELSIEDFAFDGPFGSAGATMEKVAKNHFTVVLGHAPEHPDWCNMLQFRILRNAKGNRLRLDVYFYGGNAYRFNHYAHCSWSYDANHWHPIKWQNHTKESSRAVCHDILDFSARVVDSIASQIW